MLSDSKVKIELTIVCKKFITVKQAEISPRFVHSEVKFSSHLNELKIINYVTLKPGLHCAIYSTFTPHFTCWKYFDECLMDKNLLYIFLIKLIIFKFYTNADLKICQYLRLHMKVICWKFHIKTPFTFWDMRTWDMWKVSLQTFRNKHEYDKSWPTFYEIYKLHG